MLGKFPIADANKELEHLQYSIPDYYEKTANLINKMESPNRDRVLTLLSWVYYSKTPVLKSHFSVALPIDEESERTFDNVTEWLWGDEVSSIVSASEGLVIEQHVPGRDDTLVFAHSTVRDFIKTNNDNSFHLSIDLIINTSIKFLKMSTTDLNELQILRLAQTPDNDKVRRIDKSDLEKLKSGALQCFQYLFHIEGLISRRFSRGYAWFSLSGFELGSIRGRCLERATRNAQDGTGIYGSPIATKMDNGSNSFALVRW